MKSSVWQFGGNRWTLSALAIGLMTISSSATPPPANRRVFPPNSQPYGHTYGEWGALWWQWALSIPVSTNPLFDEMGEFAGVGQSGPVFYLAGVFNESGMAERTITVPPGKALFFPVLNVEYDNECVDPPLSVEELVQAAADFTDLATELHATIDGAPVQDLFAYRATSPGPYTVTLPETDNIYQLFGCDVSGDVYPQVSDGFWLMLAPLPVGQHEINFGGTIGEPINFTLDITYHITVAPQPSD